MYISIALKLIIGLAALLIVTRVLGKKEMSQITPFDFIYALMLGGILEEGIYDDKVSILHILFTLALWAILIYIKEVEYALLETSGTLSVLKNAKCSAVTPDMLNINPQQNVPSVLMVDEGKIMEKTLARNGKSKEWLLSHLKNEGYSNIKNIFYAEWSEQNGFYIKTYDECKS